MTHQPKRASAPPPSEVSCVLACGQVSFLPFFLYHKHELSVGGQNFSSCSLHWILPRCLLSSDTCAAKALHVPSRTAASGSKYALMSSSEQRFAWTRANFTVAPTSSKSVLAAVLHYNHHYYVGFFNPLAFAPIDKHHCAFGTPRTCLILVSSHYWSRFGTSRCLVSLWLLLLPPQQFFLPLLKDVQIRLISDSKLPLGVAASVQACLSLYIRLGMISWPLGLHTR